MNWKNLRKKDITKDKDKYRMEVTIHDTAKRPWGDETLVTVTDGFDIYNFCILGTDDIESRAIVMAKNTKAAKEALVLVEEEPE